MARCYSANVRHRYPPRDLPLIWLISDARIDQRLETALARLPRGSGFIFRHYHLAPAERRARFRHLAAKARAKGHIVALSGSARAARSWGADAAYGSARNLGAGSAIIRLITVHSLRELAAAHRARADAVLISPVFATRTHLGAPSLGSIRFRLLATRALVPVIALGGMNARRARALGARRWAAIESLAQPLASALPLHS
ncbi:thiamine monophosphate synthase [Novosphingobium barchaimii]|nr:thiamine monophosphate synthase [Novosphingobium barchaimii]